MAARRTIERPLRLRTIDGMALGERLVETYVKSIRAVGLYDLVEDTAARAAFVRSVDELVRYARGQQCQTDFEVTPLKMMSILQHPLSSTTFPLVISKVLHSAIDPDALAEGDPLDELALVIAGALGRQALDAGSDIRTSWLAAHCSVSLKTVERAKLVCKGCKTGWIRSKHAKSWIATRNLSSWSQG